MSVGKKVAKWRAAQGLSQRAAATRARISQAAWQAIEADEVKRIGLDVACRVVVACDGAIVLEDFVPRRRNTPPRSAA